MRPVAPRIGFPENTMAEEQPEYFVLTVASVVMDGGQKTIVTRWRLDANERARIASGEDLYVLQLTFGQPMQALHFEVGHPTWARQQPPKIPSRGGRPHHDRGITLEHAAAAPEKGGIQRCSRCGWVLVDNSGEVCGLAGTRPHWFDAGSRVEEGDGYVCLVAAQRPVGRLCVTSRPR